MIVEPCCLNNCSAHLPFGIRQFTNPKVNQMHLMIPNYTLYTRHIYIIGALFLIVATALLYYFFTKEICVTYLSNGCTGRRLLTISWRAIPSAADDQIHPRPVCKMNIDFWRSLMSSGQVLPPPCGLDIVVNTVADKASRSEDVSCVFHTTNGIV